ncbi:MULTISPECIES: hypothetical protein [Bradyrhizobium]|uniref:hypothetical protein n=1 Tax=Bradyrhizobium elkanii TaxID=29448 RepID=UPI0027146F9E|nr:hypothetical protein [Bradyrhizobium elkanii]WLA51845.1 hypothetical protein QIH80_17995 [Bradyrhizobium elkanii]WLB77841.1 hypothetical protein QIH83_26175 [Bradyrhizobium elkanii]
MKRPLRIIRLRHEGIFRGQWQRLGRLRQQAGSETDGCDAAKHSPEHDATVEFIHIRHLVVVAESFLPSGGQHPDQADRSRSPVAPSSGISPGR